MPIEKLGPDGYFSLMFLGKIISKYTSDVGFQSLTQAAIMTHCLPDDPDTMYEAQCLIAQSDDDTFRLFEENPLHMGYFLDHISGKYVSLTLGAHAQRGLQ